MNGRLLCGYIFVIALGLFPLYGCGGGGSSQSFADEDVLNSVVSKAAENNAEAEISEAAENEPSVGSVTQSSNASNSITTDRVSVEASYSGGQVRYIVRNSSAGWSVDSAADTVLNRFAHLGENNWDGIELRKRLSGGYLYVDVYSEERTRERKDYIAGGIWIYVPDGAAEIDDLGLGVFGDGSDPFIQENLSGLNVNDPVTYEGDASVMFSAEGNIYFAEGKVALTVDFDRGTVNGRIHSFRDEEGYPIAGEVTLEKTDIGNSDSGFFRGGTDLVHPSPSLVGAEAKWGGQFFGNGNGIPRAAGGTFGFTTTGGEAAGLGVWGALSPGMPRGTGTPPDASGRVPSHPRLLSHQISPQELQPGGSGEVIITYSRVPEATDYKVHINVGVAVFPLSYRRNGPGCDVVPTADHIGRTTSTTYRHRFPVPNLPDGTIVHYQAAVQACNATGCSCPQS